MPNSDLYKQKKPLFELCRFLIDERAEHHGIMAPQTFRLSVFSPLLYLMPGENENTKWLTLKEKINLLANDGELVKNGEPRFIASGLDEAFRESNGRIDTDNSFTLNFDRDALIAYHEGLQARTRRIMQRSRGNKRIETTISGNRMIVTYDGISKSIRSKDDLEAKIITLLLGDSVLTERSEHVSIRDFAEDDIVADKAYEPGDNVDEKAFVMIIYPEKWQTEDSRGRAELIKSLQSAIWRLNKKFPSPPLIFRDTHDSERVVRIVSQ